MDNLIKDFIEESKENLDRLDQELVKRGSNPGDRELLKSIFRTIHTIKGTCYFLVFSKLEALTHSGKSLLSLLCDGEMSLTERVCGRVAGDGGCSARVSAGDGSDGIGGRGREHGADWKLKKLQSKPVAAEGKPFEAQGKPALRCGAPRHGAGTQEAGLTAIRGRE